MQNATNQMTTFPNRVPNVIEFINQVIIKPLVRWNNRRIAIAELNRLDDRMLADIGILRSEIPLVIEGKGPLDQMERKRR